MNDDIDPRILRACVDTVIEWYAPLNAEELAKNVTEQLRYAKELVQLNPDASDAWAGEVVMHRLVTAILDTPGTTGGVKAMPLRDMGDFADALEVHLKQEMSQPPHEEDAKDTDEPLDFTGFRQISFNYLRVNLQQRDEALLEAIRSALQSITPPTAYAAEEAACP